MKRIAIIMCLFALVAGMILVVGCGGGGEEAVDVTGTYKWEGLTVTFQEDGSAEVTIEDEETGAVTSEASYIVEGDQLLLKNGMNLVFEIKGDDLVDETGNTLKKQ